MRERYPILRDISASIRTRRTVEEAELALKLEGEYRADPTLFEDIDFEGLIARIDADARAENVARISTVLTLPLPLPLPPIPQDRGNYPTPHTPISPPPPYPRKCGFAPHPPAPPPPPSRGVGCKSTFSGVWGGWGYWGMGGVG